MARTDNFPSCKILSRTINLRRLHPLRVRSAPAWSYSFRSTLITPLKSFNRAMKCRLENNKVGRTIIMMLLLLPIWVESRPSCRRLVATRVSSLPTIRPCAPNSTTRYPLWTHLLKQQFSKRKKGSSRHRQLCRGRIWIISQFFQFHLSWANSLVVPSCREHNQMNDSSVVMWMVNINSNNNCRHSRIAYRPWTNCSFPIWS